MVIEADRVPIVSDENYEDILNNPQVVLMMGRSGRVICMEFKDELEKAARVFPQISFGVTWMDLNDAPRFRKNYAELLEEFDIPPTTIFLKDHKFAGRMVGYRWIEDIQKNISLVFDIKPNKD